jgi:alpha-L-fucosidase
MLPNPNTNVLKIRTATLRMAFGSLAGAVLFSTLVVIAGSVGNTVVIERDVLHRGSTVYNTIVDAVKGEVRYEPNWSSLDTRRLPQWYDDAKIGIFIHWGLFSVPSFHSEWFWYRWRVQKMKNFVEFMKRNYRPGFTYADFAAQFTAEFYDPDEWADIFQASGAKYVSSFTEFH